MTDESKSTALRACAEARPSTEQGWQPIETAPADDVALFWVVPKTPEEAYCNTSGDPIFGTFVPYIFMGKSRTWSSLSKATHWLPLPAPPRAEALATHPQHVEDKEDTRGGGVPGVGLGDLPRKDRNEVVSASATNFNETASVKENEPVTLTAACLDCGMDYSAFGMDLLLPRHQWLDIHPDEGGLLCALCIVRRASKLEGAVCMHGVIGIVPRKSQQCAFVRPTGERCKNFEKAQFCVYHRDLGAQPEADSAEILSSERSTSSGPREKASSSSSDGRAAALDAAPSSPEVILKVDDMLPQRQAMLSSAAALARSAPAEKMQEEKKNDDEDARVGSQ